MICTTGTAATDMMKARKSSTKRLTTAGAMKRT